MAALVEVFAGSFGAVSPLITATLSGRSLLLALSWQGDDGAWIARIETVRKDSHYRWNLRFAMSPSSVNSSTSHSSLASGRWSIEESDYLDGETPGTDLEDLASPFDSKQSGDYTLSESKGSSGAQSSDEADQSSQANSYTCTKRSAMSQSNPAGSHRTDDERNTIGQDGTTQVSDQVSESLYWTTD